MYKCDKHYCHHEHYMHHFMCICICVYFCMSKFDTMAFTVTADTYWPRKIVIDFPIQPGEEYEECLQMQFNKQRIDLCSHRHNQSLHH